MLLVASYVFYGFWDWRFLGLILLSTPSDFFCAIKIDQKQDRSRQETLSDGQRGGESVHPFLFQVL